MRYILPCHSSGLGDPDWNAGCDVAVVELHDDGLQALETLRKQAQTFFAQSPRLQALRYVSPVSFQLCQLDTEQYCSDDDLLMRDADRIEQETGFVVDKEHPAPRLRYVADGSTFWLLIDVDGDLYWEGKLQHCNYLIRTAPLPVKPLLPVKPPLPVKP